MRLLSRVWLLAVLMPGLSQINSPNTAAAVPTANVDIWLVDDSCRNYHDATSRDTTGMTGGSDERQYIQMLFNTALYLAMAARDSLTVALQKRPSAQDDPRGYLQWIRIADSMAVTLGFHPKADEDESLNDPYWRNAYGIYNRIVTVLQAAQNSPANGYNTQLRQLPNAKPMIMCGENYIWLGPDDNFPGTNVQVKSVPSMEREFREQGVVGGWFKNHRWHPKRQVRQKPIMCKPGTLASASARFDDIVLCDVTFTRESKNSWVSPSEVREGEKLRDIMGAPAISLLHELTHWYGGLESADDYYFDIKDQHAVDEDGYLIYAKPDGREKLYSTPLTEREMREKDLKPEMTYSVRDVFNLAKTHTSRSRRDNSGPAKALKSAEPLTVFAVMMYHQSWVWAYRGEARHPGRVYGATQQ